MNKTKQEYKSITSKSKWRYIITMIFLAVAIFIFTRAIITRSYTNFIGIILFDLFLLGLFIILFRQYQKPPCILDEDHLKIPKVTIFFKKAHKEIKYTDIKEIKLILSESVKKTNKNLYEHIYRIFIVDKNGNKYNLGKLGYEKKKFAKDLKERMGEEQWESKIEIEE